MVSLRNGYFASAFILVDWGSVLTAQVSAPVDVVEPTVAELFESLESVNGNDRIALQYEILSADLDDETRNRLIADMLEEYEPTDDPQGMGTALLARMVAHMGSRESDLALALSERVRAYGLRCKESFPEIWFDATVHRARLLMEAGDFATATKLARDVLQFGRPFGTRLRLNRPLRLLSYMASRQGFTNQSVDYLQQEYDFAVEKDDDLSRLAVLEAIATKFINAGQPEDAAEWLDKADAILETTFDARLSVFIKTRRAMVDASLGELESALESMRETTSGSLDSLRYDEVPIIYEALADLEMRAGNFDRAIEIIETSLNETPGQPLDDIFLELNLIECRIGKQQFELAIDGLLKLEEKIPEGSDFHIRRLKLLADCYAQTGEFAKAYARLEDCRVLSGDAAYRRSKSQLMLASAMLEDQQKTYELQTAQQDADSARLEAEKKAIELAAEREKAARATLIRNLTASTSFLAVVLAIGLAWAWSSRRIRRELETLNANLREELSKRVAEIEVGLEQRRLLEYEVERKRRHEAVGKIAGGIAHDFNNLLTVVIGVNHFLELRKDELSDDTSEMVAISMQAATTGAKIVNQLSTYAGRAILTEATFCIDDWFTENLELFRATLGEPNELRFEGAGHRTYVHLDAAQLTTALLNLICNAKAAISPPGTVSIKVESELVSEGEEERTMLKIIVRDTGCGMNEDQLRQACEPFYTLRRSGVGSGLGLSTVSGFIAQSNGTLNIESSVGEGTCVTMRFPVTASPPTPEARAEATEIARGKGVVLLVEDQDDLRRVAASLLEKLGYEVNVASNADAALDFFFSDQPPGLVLTDIRMPGSMDGLTFRDWVREAFPETDVILMSGYTDHLQDITGPFLPKPFTMQQLADVLPKKR